jgi:hypothetical protein
MVDIPILNGGYKPTFYWGAPPCKPQLSFQVSKPGDESQAITAAMAQESDSTSSSSDSG